MFNINHYRRRIHGSNIIRQVRSIHYQLCSSCAISLNYKMACEYIDTGTFIISFTIQRICFITFLSQYRLARLYCIVIVIMQYVFSFREINDNPGICIVVILTVLTGHVILLQYAYQGFTGSHTTGFHTFFHIENFIS